MVPRIVFRLPWCALCLLSLVCLSGPAIAQPLVASGEALDAREQQKKFHLPPGFEIQLFASEPAIHKPMNITFDNQGRLFVTDTVEYPYPAKPGVTPRDSVKVLVDRNFDGQADEITTLVDGLNIPLGVMPIQGGVVVYGIPAMMRCLDTDGDGKFDQRETLYQNFGNRDTHGMINSFTHGLDGWLYACHGFANDSSPQGTDGQAIQMNSGNTFRMRLDGSHVEYFTHGQVNPFGLAFDPLNNLYSADCHTMPVYMLLRGAYYPSFGKAHDGLDFGPTMIGHNHGSTGIGGIAYYAAEQFPPEYRDTLMIGNPVTGRVNFDRVKAHGSTYEAVELPDFVTCDDPWFRPVNLQVGPDGALYIADFYNRIIGHYEVPLEHPGRDRERGRIWRVVYTGKGVDNGPQTAPAWGPNVSQASRRRLIELLGHGNLTVRTQATHELVERIGPSAINPLKDLLSSPQSSPWQRVHGLWALERLGGMTPALVSGLSRDSSRDVRVHVMKMLAERPEGDAALALAALADADPFVRRAAGEVLGRHPRPENVKPLLDLWASTPAEDTHLIHVARMALRDQLMSPGVYAQLTALVGSDAAQLERLSNVSLGAPGTDSAAFVWRQLQAHPDTVPSDTQLQHVTRYLAESDLPAVFALALNLKNLKTPQQTAVVRALSRGAKARGAKLPDDVTAWAARLTSELLAGGRENQVRSGIELAREMNPPVFAALAAAAGREAQFDRLRPVAMDACVANDAKQSVALLAGILADSAEPINVRQHAAACLARINDDDSRGQLLGNLQSAQERLAIEIAAALCDSKPGAEGLLAAVEGGKASPRLLLEVTVSTRLKARGLEKLDERLAKLTAGLPPEDARIKELIAQRHKSISAGKPDLVAGAALFQKHCAVCHRIGDQGAKIGPNLDGVGIRGLDRLLEDVLDPSRNVDQAFRTTQIVSTDGQIFTGLALREEGKIVVLADSQGKEVRIDSDEIDQRNTSPLSLMPSNVPDLMNEAEFAHLVGYLLSQRVPAAQQ